MGLIRISAHEPDFGEFHFGLFVEQRGRTLQSGLVDNQAHRRPAFPETALQGSHGISGHRREVCNRPFADKVGKDEVMNTLDQISVLKRR